MKRTSLFVGLALVEEENGGGDAGAEEEIGRQADDGLQQVFLISFWRMRPSAAPRKSTPCGTTTPTRPVPSRAVSIMWVMKA
jgi:hypothetical protein